jgi:hypothetical protein
MLTWTLSATSGGRRSLRSIPTASTRGLVPLAVRRAPLRPWSPCRGSAGAVVLRSLFAPACPGNGFSLHEPATGIIFFYFDLTEGSQGTIEAGWRH